MDRKAPLWRPYVTAAVLTAAFVLRERTTRLESRSLRFFLVWAGFWTVVAVGVWAAQRLRGRNWGWTAELGAMVGVVILFAVGLNLTLRFLGPTG